MQKNQKYKFKADRKIYEAEAQVLEVPRAGVLPTRKQTEMCSQTCVPVHIDPCSHAWK